MENIRDTPADELSAIRALQKIHDRKGSADRVFAAAMRDRLEKEWAEENGLCRAEGHICIHRLLDFHCPPVVQDTCELMPPHTDHASLWIKDGRPHCLVSQPYELEMEDIEEIIDFCKEHDLSFDIDGYPGFHFPSRVLFVVFRPAEKGSVQLQELEECQ